MNPGNTETIPKILLINGPNLNLLGLREPGIYGCESLDAVEKDLQELAIQRDIQFSCFQSNHEGAIVDRIQSAMGATDYIIINPGALTHYSIALYDALKGSGIPFIEIHISNIYAREEFRQKSLLSPIASGVIGGLGTIGYRLALLAIADRLLAKN